MILSLGLFLVMPYIAQAQTACSAGNLNGSYAFNFTGSVLNASANYSLVAIGILKFDGQGGFTGSDSFSLTFADVVRRTLSGTYTVNADCIGTIVINASDHSTVNGDIVVVRGGRSVNFLQTDHAATLIGEVFSGVMQRQDSGPTTIRRGSR